jgi:predicted O-methyltransferase YrrM
MKLDLYGWFPEENEKILSELIKQLNIKTVVEIGCFLGKSTKFFVDQGCTVISIDTFEGAKDLNNCEEVKKRLPNLRDQFLYNLKALGIEDKVTVYTGTSEQAYDDVYYICGDLIFVDGSHEYEDVSLDIKMWLNRAGKIICGDDYSEHHPGVRRAVDELLPDANKDQRLWYKILN